MNLQQLLEHAHLDALGQLDEREQAAFEAAFVTAPPSVQEQIRKEQARFANMDHLLPQVEPPAYLRERVLNAVSAAMLAESVGQPDMTMRPSRRVHSGWRAVSIGLMTAVVVIGAAFVNVYNANQSINRQFEADVAHNAVMAQFTHKYMNAVLYSPDTKRVLFTAEPGVASADHKAVLWVNQEEWDDSRMYCQLPELANATYRVVQLDANNKPIKTLSEFQGDGKAKSFSLAQLASGTKLAIVRASLNATPEEGTVLLTALV